MSRSVSLASVGRTLLTHGNRATEIDEETHARAPDARGRQLTATGERQRKKERERKTSDAHGREDREKQGKLTTL